MVPDLGDEFDGRRPAERRRGREGIADDRLRVVDEKVRRRLPALHDAEIGGARDDARARPGQGEREGVALMIGARRREGEGRAIGRPERQARRGEEAEFDAVVGREGLAHDEDRGRTIGRGDDEGEVRRGEARDGGARDGGRGAGEQSEELGSAGGVGKRGRVRGRAGHMGPSMGIDATESQSQHLGRERTAPCRLRKPASTMLPRVCDNFTPVRPPLRLPGKGNERTPREGGVRGRFGGCGWPRTALRRRANPPSPASRR